MLGAHRRQCRGEPGDHRWCAHPGHPLARLLPGTWRRQKSLPRAQGSIAGWLRQHHAGPDGLAQSRAGAMGALRGRRGRGPGGDRHRGPGQPENASGACLQPGGSHGASPGRIGPHPELVTPSHAKPRHHGRAQRPRGSAFSLRAGVRPCAPGICLRLFCSPVQPDLRRRCQ